MYMISTVFAVLIFLRKLIRLRTKVTAVNSNG